jgi:hypothetical protein
MKLMKGQVWLTREGKKVTMADSRKRVGSAMHYQPDGKWLNDQESPCDLVELVSQPFEVGQVWIDANGNEKVIQIVQSPAEDGFPIKAGGWYSQTGRCCVSTISPLMYLKEVKEAQDKHFEVGQVWIDGDGEERVIERIELPNRDPWPIQARGVWHTNSGISNIGTAPLMYLKESVKPKLDTSKPMRMDDGSEVTFVDRTESGKVLVWDSDIYLRLLDTDDLENVPEVKPSASLDLVLILVNGTWEVTRDLGGCNGLGVAGRATVTITAGDGMTEESK